MKKVLYYIFILSVLLMSWDGNKQDMAIASSVQEQTIPNEAIRLRIIANSDSAEDQWIKRKVRDVVVAKINPWVGDLTSLEEARVIIKEHLPELRELVNTTLEENGYDYTEAETVELGVVSFPTKMYGQVVYPAGDYEALRITLGNAEGQNWWCVLFPPLCFVDMSTGEAVQEADTDDDAADLKVEATDSTATVNTETNEDVEVRFFLFELVLKIVSFIKGIV